MRTLRAIILTIIFFLLIFSLAYSSDLATNIIGTWTPAKEWISGSIEIFKDGKIIWGNREGTYKIINNNILQVKFKPDAAGISLSYNGTIEIKDDILTLNDGKETPLKYEKVK